MSPEAAALYLFLVTVADRQGLSYYADHNIGRLLAMTATPLEQARACLVANQLIAYRAPLYQVLELPAVNPRQAASGPRWTAAATPTGGSADQAWSMARILQRLGEGGHDRL
ncbi:MAG: hypothetical protein ACNA74_09255 [Desulfurivibrio sp.]